MNYEKLNLFFNWKPKTSFNKGIEKTNKWYKKILKYDANNFTSS